MFSNLTDRLSSVIDRLKGQATLTESHVNDALKEIRIALLDADVALPVVKDFVEKIRTQAIGQDIIKNTNAAQMVIKIVYDHLVEALGPETAPLNFQKPLTSYMLVGLQGAGKTTFTAKLAQYLKNKHQKKILMVSLDVYRPAAQKQLEILGQQIGIDTQEISDQTSPVDIAHSALKYAKQEKYDLVLFDTAGRLHIDTALMKELEDITQITAPQETFLVVDAMTGQDAVKVAQHFQEQLSLTGIVLTRIDGDARGGAALSMRSITNCPVKFLSTGEKLDQITDFHPKRIASRILDMGDIVSLVEKASEMVDQKEAEKLFKKLNKGKFDFNDLAAQLKQVTKMGNLKSILNFIPGMAKMKAKIDESKLETKLIRQQIAIISSMTARERRFPKLLNTSRKERISKGSGTSIPEVNKLIKQLDKTIKMMKKLKKYEKKGLLDENNFTLPE